MSYDTLEFLAITRKVNFLFSSGDVEVVWLVCYLSQEVILSDVLNIKFMVFIFFLIFCPLEARRICCSENFGHHRRRSGKNALCKPQSLTWVPQTTVSCSNFCFFPALSKVCCAAGTR